MSGLVFCCVCFLFFFNDTATTEIYTLSLHDALPIRGTSREARRPSPISRSRVRQSPKNRSEEHTSELQSHSDLVCRLLLEKNKKRNKNTRVTVLVNVQVGYGVSTAHTSADTRSWRAPSRPVLCLRHYLSFFFFLKNRAPPEFYPLPLPAPLPI